MPDNPGTAAVAPNQGHTAVDIANKLGVASVTENEPVKTSFSVADWKRDRKAADDRKEHISARQRYEDEIAAKEADLDNMRAAIQDLKDVLSLPFPPTDPTTQQTLGSIFDIVGMIPLPGFSTVSKIANVCTQIGGMVSEALRAKRWMEDRERMLGQIKDMFHKLHVQEAIFKKYLQKVYRPTVTSKEWREKDTALDTWLKKEAKRLRKNEIKKNPGAAPITKMPGDLSDLGDELDQAHPFLVDNLAGDYSDVTPKELAGGGFARNVFRVVDNGSTLHHWASFRPL